MRSVQRILAVFESFSPDSTSLTLQEIADRIGLPKSTAFRIVQSIEMAGYLVRLDDQRYCLTFRFTRLAGLVSSTLGIRDIARPIASELADSTKETVTLQMLSGQNRICIDAVAATAALRSVTQPGEQIPLVSGAGSKILVAYMPKAQLAPMAANMARTLKRPKADVIAELAKVRDQGYAVSHGERVLGMSAVSAPIRGVDEQVHYCLSVAGPTIRVQVRESELIKAVVVAANDISRQYGGDVQTAAA